MSNHVKTDLPEKLSDDFARDGFVRIDPLFGPEEMTAINGAVAQFLRDGVARMPSEQVYREDRSDPTSIKQLQKQKEGG